MTFPIPGVPGATASATLDSKYTAERVVVKQGANTTEFIYSDYQDWNNPLNKIEAFHAMTERLNGKVVRDLTTIQTEAGQCSHDARSRKRPGSDHADGAASGVDSTKPET